MSSNERRTARLGRIAALSGGMALAVSALMLMAPATVAATASVTLHAPWKTLPQSSSFGVSVTGCGKGKNTAGPSFSTKTGTFRISGEAIAPACKLHPGQQSYASWDGSWNTQGPFTFKTNGTHNVTWNWKLTAATSWNISTFNCTLNYHAVQSECYASAFVELITVAQLFDQTTFTNFTSTSSTVAFNSTSHDSFSQLLCPTCLPTGSNSSSGVNGVGAIATTGSTSLSMTGVNSSHTYNMYFTVIAIAYAYAYTINAHSSAPVTAVSKINMGTGTNGFVLGSLVIA